MKLHQLLPIAGFVATTACAASTADVCAPNDCSAPELQSPAAAANPTPVAKAGVAERATKEVSFSPLAAQDGK
jgi:hypothetical protein